MASLARGQENQHSDVNWFITVNGTLTDAFEVGFQIYDITAGLPGTQVFPAVAGEWETVSGTAGNFMPGSYYAYDVAEAKGYTPPLSASIGTHRIVWRWKILATSAYQSGQEDFEVLVMSSGGTVDTYISVQDVRDAGLTDETAYPDDMVLAYIETWQAFLDRACRQWFLPKTLILKVDGTDSDAIHFGVPIISIDYVRLNSSEDNLDTGLYEVYNSLNQYPDDRKNPRIKLVRACQQRDIFSRPATYGDLRFRKGRQNQEIKGMFGYVEADMTTPLMIQRALLLLVIEKITKPVYLADPATQPAAPPPILGNILEEETDWHRIKYGQPGGEVAKRSPYLTGITSNPEVIEIIKLYKAPIGVATPAHNSHQ